MKKNAYLVLLISCWVLLGLAAILKIFFTDMFEPKTTNQTFLAFCDYIDNHTWLKYTIYCINALILNTLTSLAILEQKFYTKLQFIIFIPFIIGMSIINWYSRVANIILGVIFCLLPIIWLKKRWYRAVIGTALIFAFQGISLLIKNISVYNLNNASTVVALIMQIDTVIMVGLYYLYANRKNFKKEDA